MGSHHGHQQQASHHLHQQQASHHPTLRKASLRFLRLIHHQQLKWLKLRNQRMVEFFSSCFSWELDAQFVALVVFISSPSLLGKLTLKKMEKERQDKWNWENNL